MILNPEIPLHRLILSLSEALDCIHPAVADHQQRVAYIATRIARRMGLRGEDLIHTFNAAALHDIGLIGLENKVDAFCWDRMERVSWHGEAGYHLLRENPLFSDAAEMVRHHHVAWNDGRGQEADGCPVPPASHLLHLADTVERMIDRNLCPLTQATFITEQITAGSGRQFHPDCVAAFLDVSDAESFWLDATSRRIYGILLRHIDWPTVIVDVRTLGSIARIFGRIVDSASRWTAVHSAGVAAAAVALSERLKFSPRELQLMRGAGYVHDLGKLLVPTQILDKPGKLTAEEFAVIKGHTYHTFHMLETIGDLPQIREWASFHHERLDGAGYPFRHTGADLTLGSRVMAVADTFAALTEDRPYRKGMDCTKVLSLLDKLAVENGMDGDVVATLRRNHADIEAICRKERAEYAREQQQLAAIMRCRAKAPSAAHS